MKNIWTILCRSSSVDTDNNTISLFDCVEKLKVALKEKPKEIIALPIEMQLVSMWLKESDDVEKKVNLKIDFVDPKDKVLQSNKVDFTSEKEKIRHRHRLYIKGLPITISGRYYFNTFIEQEKGKFIRVNQIPLDIDVSQSED